MNIFKKITNFFKRRRFNLRQACIDRYTAEFGEKAGQEFGRMYDTLASGGTIGGFLETACVLDMIERVKKDSGLWN